MEGYTPFKMKAKDYGNSPMLMNFSDSFPGGVGSSPAKGFFSRIAKKVKNLSKKKSYSFQQNIKKISCKI